MVNRYIDSVGGISPLRLLARRLFPGQCILCYSASQLTLDMCKSCELSLPILGACCESCALPISDISARYCGGCLQSPPPYSRTEACWVYDVPVAQLIAAYKYRHKLSYGHTLSIIAARKFASTYEQIAKPTLIAAVPLHWYRHLRRGFNQSDLLAKYFSKYFQIPLFTNIKRVKATETQLSLSAKERQTNLKNAFLISRPEYVTGQVVAVIDDVMTTGATARAVSETFLKAGAREVHIWVLARTPR
ncbi:MAG: ComF family protein [Oceanicoccus sp.]|jgi:ComF family protein